MKPLELQLKGLLGAEEYNRFAETVLFPAIQQLAESGKLGNSDLAKLAKLARTYGAGIFDVAATDIGDATKHSLSDGFSVIARYKLNDDLEFKLFVKKFSDRKSYERGVTIQEEIVKSLKGTELEGIVPSQVYKNPKKRIVMMPLVEAKSLTAALPESEAEKEALLKRTIAEYLKVAEHVSAKKLFVPPDRNIFGKIWYDDFKLPSLQDFDKFFAKGFGADGELAESYRKHIGSRLNGNASDFVHGDLHPGNILVNGRTHFIDWELAANGFKEFDLYKLFTKSGVDGGLEERLLEFAGASRERYRLNQVTQDLLTAERYSKRARQDKKRSEKLESMALTAYNIALRHIEKAEVEGILDVEFRQVLEMHVAKSKPYHRVSDDEFGKLLLEYNPHTTLSQENLITQGTEAPVPVDKEARQRNLDVIRKSLHKKDWGRIAKLGTAAALLLGLSGFGGWKYLESELARQKLEQKDKQETFDRSYRHDFCRAFEVRTEAELHDGKIRWSYTNTDRLGKVRLYEDREQIKQVCEKYNLDPDFVEKMYYVNATYADVANNDLSRRGINFFDPYRATYVKGTDQEKFDPVCNLEGGAKRLSRLFDKYNVDRGMIKKGNVYGASEKIKNNDPSLQPLIHALKQFYLFEKRYSNDEGEDEDYRRQLIEFKSRNIKTPEAVREIIYAILTDGPHADMNGALLYITTILPKNFMLE